jgi:hypothetical protein
MRYLATTKGLAKETGIPECSGCRLEGKECSFIKSSCVSLREKKIDFCYECQEFPCKKLERLNRRYTTKYQTNLINNLLKIKHLGLDAWLEKEKDRWRCPQCGGTMCIHDRKCYDCGHQAEKIP